VTSSIIEEDIRSILDLPVAWERLSGARVLVTGATGMVGQYVTRALLGLGARLDTAPNVTALVQNNAKATRLFADDPNVVRYGWSFRTSPSRFRSSARWTGWCTPPARRTPRPSGTTRSA
jgi:hypothetical protein